MKPSLTPRTILLTSARLRPCSAFACASSPWRLTTTLPLSTFRLVRLGSSQFNLPLGPSTETCWPLTSTLTLSGIVMGCFPIRLIQKTGLVDKWIGGLPYVTKQFTADIFLTSLISGHQAFGGR